MFGSLRNAEVKGILFLGDRNDFKLIIVTGAKKYVHLEGGKGILPPAHQEDGEKCGSLPDLHPMWGHPMKFISTSSGSITVHHRLSRQLLKPCSKAEASSSDELPRTPHPG